MPMALEGWPGGRWYRDLGNNTGHFWDTVEAIKTPSLLEICGPLFYVEPCRLEPSISARGRRRRDADALRAPCDGLDR